MVLMDYLCTGRTAFTLLGIGTAMESRDMGTLKMIWATVIDGLLNVSDWHSYVC